MASLGSRISVLLLALLGFTAPAAASIPVTTGESDSDTFPETSGEPPQLITIVQPTSGDVFSGTPDATIQLIIEFETLDGADIKLDARAREGGDGPWTTVREDACPAGPSPCMLEISLPPALYMLYAIGEGPGGASEIDVISVEVVEAAATDTDTTDGATGETEAAPTGSSTDDPTGADSTGSTTGDGASASGGDSADGEKGCACNSGTGGPDLLGLTLALLFIPRLRRRR
ncbi:hypothetical protein [Nannocystis bainbridge]|uniref:MYXO-CTERM domain-containing protein n=1 Tax=Nannocystis bainbridge TaxID=2995303 RepID=A0ABT5E0R4_9BACT|nr:hypothetical protein [Nannocystis bainbridge]MDC0718291.1 hypothetical protein [Nannocystis bainbridge]